VDAAQALADLTEISSQIQTAVLFDEAGEVAASTLGDDAPARELVASARELLEAGAGLREGGQKLTQLEAATVEGSVFVVSQGDRRIVATTSPEPTVGLVFYDLKSCLRGIDDGGGAEPEPQPASAAAPKKRPRKKAENDAA
jgi:predicted regulator of Ras-like GTPase activity (Roadblock/LC7/MglB family)